MADGTESPRAVKVEEHSQCVILTYFHGDIGTMVDAHFTRALGKICKAKAPAAKSKKTRKPVKLEEPDSSQWRATNPCSYSEVQVQPVAGRLQLSSSKEPQCSLTLSSADDSPAVWHSLPARPIGGPGLQPIPYSLSTDGLGLTGQQYATSLLNLLHSDRPEMGPGMASGSKPELLPSWPMPQGFRDSVDPAVSFEPGRHPNKKDLYWY
ncbi:transcription cofactor vestigial-like protein 1 [Genypterus blacodes]|uniref:transcription cofactor vestigial-like protein 1 n=1 Tax=Genypterus blacodes TaxID=154954 RepID=UPI003F7664BC